MGAGVEQFTVENLNFSSGKFNGKAVEGYKALVLPHGEVLAVVPDSKIITGGDLIKVVDDSISELCMTGQVSLAESWDNGLSCIVQAVLTNLPLNFPGCFIGAWFITDFRTTKLDVCLGASFPNTFFIYPVFGSGDRSEEFIIECMEQFSGFTEQIFIALNTIFNYSSDAVERLRKSQVNKKYLDQAAALGEGSIEYFTALSEIIDKQSPNGLRRLSQKRRASYAVFGAKAPGRLFNTRRRNRDDT